MSTTKFDPGAIDRSLQRHRCFWAKLKQDLEDTWLENENWHAWSYAYRQHLESERRPQTGSLNASSFHSGIEKVGRSS